MMGEARVEELRRTAAAHFRESRWAEAERAIAQALTIAPHAADLWANRGSALAQMRRREEALAAFDRAIALDPNLTPARANRANMLFELQRSDEAAAEFDRVLAADPDRPYASGNRLLCKLNCCDWDGYEPAARAIVEKLRAGKRAVPPALSIALLDSASDQRIAAEIVTRDKAPAFLPVWRGERYAHARIRLAYLSADFHAHATAVLAAGLFEAHDRSRFETFAVSWGQDDGSPMRRRLVSAFEHFIDIAGVPDGQAAAMLRNWEIDIAVDLKGYTSDARPGLLARRPAPIQVNYLGFPSTMGAPFMDYIVADPIVIPEDFARFYSERAVRLPNSYQPNDSQRAAAEGRFTRADEGLPEDAFVFCCFNAPFKILPPVLDIWMRLLAETPRSVLWLLAGDVAAANLRREAKARGIAPERLVFAARRPLHEHLARHALADLFLDTFPYNAHTTGSDALWMGLPVLTCTGETFASRVAASLLHAAGLPELVTRSFADYGMVALRLARNPVEIAAIRARLAANRHTCPLFDTAKTARDLESAYAEMIARLTRGEPPADIAIPARC